MKKTNLQKPNKAMVRREDRLKDRTPKIRGLSLYEWQRQQRILAEQREALRVFERVHAEIQEAQGVSDQVRKA